MKAFKNHPPLHVGRILSGGGCVAVLHATYQQDDLKTQQFPSWIPCFMATQAANGKDRRKWQRLWLRSAVAAQDGDELAMGAKVKAVLSSI